MKKKKIRNRIISIFLTVFFLIMYANTEYQQTKAFSPLISITTLIAENPELGPIAAIAAVALAAGVIYHNKDELKAIGQMIVNDIKAKGHNVSEVVSQDNSQVIMYDWLKDSIGKSIQNAPANYNLPTNVYANVGYTKISSGGALNITMNIALTLKPNDYVYVETTRNALNSIYPNYWTNAGVKVDNWYNQTNPIYNKNSNNYVVQDQEKFLNKTTSNVTVNGFTLSLTQGTGYQEFDSIKIYQDGSTVAINNAIPDNIKTDAVNKINAIPTNDTLSMNKDAEIQGTSNLNLIASDTAGYLQQIAQTDTQSVGILQGIKDLITGIPAAIWNVFTGTLEGIRTTAGTISTGIGTVIDKIGALPLAISQSIGDFIKSKVENLPDPGLPNLFLLLLLILLALIKLLLASLAFIIAMRGIPADPSFFPPLVVQGIDFTKNLDIPVFQTSFYNVILSGVFIISLLKVVKVVRKAIDKEF